MPLFKFQRKVGQKNPVLHQIDERGHSIRELTLTAPRPAPPPAEPPRDELLEEIVAELQKAVEDDERPAAMPPVAVAHPSHVLQDVTEKLYLNNADWAKGMVVRFSDPVELARFDAIERAHPQFEGGRISVLKAIAEQVRALK